MSEQDTLYNIIRDGMHRTVHGSGLKGSDVILGTAHTTVTINLGEIEPGTELKPGEHIRVDSSGNVTLEQDTREQLEAWAHEEIAERWAQSDREVTLIMDDLLDLLDRQAAITAREAKLRELYRFEENHRASIDKTEEVNRKLNERIAELTATCDALREQREYWFDEAVEIYRRFYPHDEYGIPQNIAEMVLAKVDELQATNKPNSQFDVLKTAENAENVTSKNEIRNFDASREQLEADILAHYKTPEEKLLTVRKWLDRQAAITRRGCAKCADGMGAYADSLCDPLKVRIAELTAELETYRNYTDQGKCDNSGTVENETSQVPELDAVSILRNAANHTSANTSIGDMLRYTVPGSGAAPWQLEEDACEALASIIESQLAELTAERDNLQASIDAMENGQFYSMYKAKCEECEQLKKVVRTQADSFKKLEIELGKQ